ncbi:fumarylacetoacetate hydrolase [Herbihabitans rhizosphaerae]|uniref:fumarylacetoacetase n=1 Tax=Herbihabitans rhizosphaerae TaxID=1872711 RepID=A0A4Q7L768_9PSEU|nr:fumarylacetoacetase [Herbihabitans rhizosphaerae]RZS45235.1 fumarylacetoacetate hydrolase [Herbihabitans rhizosphaerae]
MSWIDDPEFDTSKPFGPQTLPYGVITAAGRQEVAVRVGDHALPLAPLAASLGERLAALVSGDSLDTLLAAGHTQWTELRARLTEIVTADTAPDGATLVPLSTVDTVLPFRVGDYVDFYSSRYHAENAGRIFRPDGEPLLPNWTHLPVGYHGRSGTVFVSGTEIRRPHGQRRGSDGPKFGPSARLDIEAEVGFVCGGPVASRVSTSDADQHVFGVVLLNDWSARDIQGWEAQPLGPFLGKSFATSISAWVTPLEAFDAARVDVPDPGHTRMDYLLEKQPCGLDLRLEVHWNGALVSTPPFKEMSYSCAQQLAHMTVNGATVRPGDLFGSGTVSGPERQQWGSFLELSWGGKEPIDVGGTQRTFLEDGDSVVITATAPGANASVVGLAEVAGTIAPAE